ncbi:ABC-2 type transport system ATP-binding protein/lipopolysaccharide transport system ATP-binding protein [Desulfitobacterium sp. LBE]|uniref:ABC transporter ATP-binding protein n=1 Tax=Desulfitobacterium sp. LBE TaxID=884086 RepID=UPI0011998DD5|nr:ABC transporter ATP-binding protein [Desulfitobacterium sp. LBE]TWH59721.1 ABC-2 type transport system ATP-binding protein/lipopolysaccharide transport system ATP-binding protein [Desulfitobacterium sp. LBE]
MSKNIIEINNISMMFNRSKEQVDNLKEYLIRLSKRNLFFEEFWALKNISFNIEKGESIGIVGLNGSGKSTLLKIIAQVMKPTNGEVKVYGSVAPLIELGAGFDMDLSARENVFLNGAVLGHSRLEMRKKFDSIIDFAELWDFVDVPIKNFSSGMIARLGFAIATANSPDILILDEILGVGDFKFQKKCESRIREITENDATVIFVSHSIEQVMELCKKAVWLNKGQMVMYGEVNEVCQQYNNS